MKIEEEKEIRSRMVAAVAENKEEKREVQSMKNLFKGRILLLLIFVLGAGMLFLANTNVGYMSRINSLQSELAEQKKQKEVLEGKLLETEKNLQSEIATIKGQLEAADRKLEDMPQLQMSEIEQLKEKGLKDPISDLKADLMKRGNLIPYKGVLGGTMNFYSEEGIHILSSKWAVAYFDDGHINGIMLLKYSIQKDGRIRWTVMDSKLY